MNAAPAAHATTQELVQGMQAVMVDYQDVLAQEQ